MPLDQHEGDARKGAAQMRCEAREERQKRKGKPKGYEGPARLSDGQYVLLAVGLLGVLAYCTLKQAAPRQLSWLDRNWRWAVACVLAAPFAALAAYVYWMVFKEILA